MIQTGIGCGAKICLADIYKPISEDLLSVKKELADIVNEYIFDSSGEILEHLFKMPGKMLRPALLLLSARAANGNISENQRIDIVRMAAAMELIHTASLVHDDVIDGDFLRRGQKTVNNVYGNKIAVLAGDTLYTGAFLTIASRFPKEFMRSITGMTRNMCAAEIEQARGTMFVSDRDKYYRMIQNKTAIFMECCCKFGASLTTDDKGRIAAFDNYGLNFGMTYQIVDDYADKDPIGSMYAGLKEAEAFAARAESSLAGIEDTIYKTELLDLIKYVMGLSHV